MTASEPCPICATALPEPAIGAPDRLHGTPGRFAVATCPGCGAGVTLPRVGADELARFYPARYAPYEARESRVVAVLSAAVQAWQGARARRTPPLRSVAALAPGRGVDVGCGRGDLAAMLVARGWRMTGVEPSPEACALARERGVDARAGVLATVELEPGSYDAALFRQSLEHTVDPVADLRRVHAALAPGGVVAISVPNFASWQARRFGGRWYHLDLPRHRVHFTAGALARALDAAGFQGVATSTSTSAVGLWASVQYALFGRCLFPHGLGLRAAVAACTTAWPLVAAADRAAGGG
ncbi:MAG TPA: class I SAM-dependent methyltransferase, partial [Solirubrobacteraceae bacterium]|nr:class I SAM-dependent methyltransferase [Solirubrobacteraceae bacterium]